MISTDFAANENWDDALISLKLIFKPWTWLNGKTQNKVKDILLNKIIKSNRPLAISFFLSGRSALFFLLKSHNLGQNSEVIVQGFTCEAVILPIQAAGLKPIYIDIESQTYSMNFKNLKEKFTPRAKVLILQHTFGLTPKHRNEIINFALKNKLIIIEDLAHGFHQSIFNDKSQITIINHYYLLSFGRSKYFSSVFGSGIVSSKKDQSLLTNQLEKLKYPSYLFIFRCLLYKPLTMLIKSTYDIYLGKILHKILMILNLLIPEITQKEKKGQYNDLFDKRYPNALAVLLLNQLQKFDQFKNNRATITKIYQKTLENRQLIFANPYIIRYPLLVNKRDQILSKLEKQNIFLGKWYDQVVAPKGLDINEVGYSRGTCKVAEEICEKIINLPSNISEKEARILVSTLNDVINNHY